jgi:hypothetical protein
MVPIQPPIEMLPTYSNTILFSKVPIPPSCHTVNTSPFLNIFFGLQNHPTPLGVPIKQSVPAGIVVPDDKNDSASWTGKIQSLREGFSGRSVFTSYVIALLPKAHLVLSSCITVPLRQPLKANAHTLPTRSGLTRTGPIGQNLSKPFAKFHCACLN